jgi:hypothetical protein
MNNTTTSIFATEDTPAAEVSALIAATLEVCTSAGDELKWAELSSVCPSIKYSRGWLIARRAQLEEYAPELLTRLVKASKGSEERYAHAKKFHAARLGTKLSWGELAVRFGVSESYVRECFKLAGVEKDLGLRIGKGGRFAYGDPTLYLENRKAEGAQIPVELKGRPAVEQLLNFKADRTMSTAAQKGKAMSTIVKLQNLRQDKATPAEQHDAIDEKIADLMNKHNITVADLGAWKAARASKGRKAS